MESVNGVSVEDDIGVIEKSIVEGSVKEVKNANNGENAPNLNEITEPVTKPKGPKKGPNSGSSKNSKITMDNPSSKGSASSAHSTRPSFTQSLSFPARGPRADQAMKKSVHGYTVKSEAKSVRNGGKVDSNGTVTSVSRLNLNNRRASTGITSNGSNTNGAGAVGRRSTLASVLSSRQSMV